jgi:hypothetical protein
MWNEWNDVDPLRAKYESPAYDGYTKEDIDALVEADIRAINLATGHKIQNSVDSENDDHDRW